ncbi:hypothetical protein ACKC5O_00160 [Aeromonas schubertii]|uniref:hypothetical protein n=1 Tax=Aeromonas schubertii TaxID=652 RepID=UPI0038B4DE87
MKYSEFNRQLRDNHLDEVAALTLIDWIGEWSRHSPQSAVNDSQSLCTVDFHWPERHDKPLLQVDGYGRIWFYHERISSSALQPELEAHFGDVFGELETGPVSCLQPLYWQGRLQDLTHLLKRHL